MTTSDWISIISAILIGGGTLFLGIMAWLTIRQTRSIQKAEKRERLLNEIIEWAIDVSKRGADINFLLLAAQIDEEPWGGLNLPSLQSNLRELKQRGEYILKVAETLDEPLLAATQKAENEIAKYLSATDNIFIQIKFGTEGNLSMILKPLSERDSLGTYANDLLTEAVKIKTKGIG
jgi:hypothetical protein